MFSIFTILLAQAGGQVSSKPAESGESAEYWNILEMINYELIRGNELWRFAAVLFGVITTLVAARIAQYALKGYVNKQKKKGADGLWTIIVDSLSKPLYVAVFAIGLNFCKVFLYFHDEKGIKTSIGAGWDQAVEVLTAIALAYALYKLVDVVEYYLGKLVKSTSTELDDMLVPVIRKSVRITIVIIAVLFIAQAIVGADQIKSVLLGAGLGGLAVALAAKDTIANLFGSITIFADRPFNVGELIDIDGHLGPVEEVGFRSTRVRTLYGHLVTIPNSSIANSTIDNLGKRPYIRRTSDITITYSSGYEKTELAVGIIKEELSKIAEINTDPLYPPRVYFDEFNESSLNIYMSYWVKPADYWLYKSVNEKVNFALIKRFENEGIEFAFPTQTVYLRHEDDQRQ
jgi:MscS family membrane protein